MIAHTAMFIHFALPILSMPVIVDLNGVAYSFLLFSFRPGETNHSSPFGNEIYQMAQVTDSGVA